MKQRNNPLNRQFIQFMICAGLILLVGFAIRVTVHDFFGLDGDDAFSLLFSRNDPGTIITKTLSLEVDLHPPLHYLALKVWTGLTGESLLALRMMNILLDLLTGAVLMRLGGRLYGRRGGLMTGLLWSAAPLLVFADYLVRMYSLITFFAAAGMWCVVEGALACRRQGWWYAAGAFFGLAALYSHSFGTIVLAGLGIGAVVGMIFQPRQVVIAGLVAFGGAGILAMPYLGSAYNLYRSGRKLGSSWSFYSFGNAVDIPGTVLSVLTAHRLITERVIILMMVPLAAILTWLLWGRFGRRIMPLLAIFWVNVIVVSGLIAVAHIYKTFYLTAFVPAALAILAGLILLVPRPILQGLALVALVGILGWGTLNDLGHTTRDDPFAAAQFIESHERPGDMVLVTPDWAQELFKYHYHGSSDVVGAFQGITRDMDLDHLLPTVTNGHQGVWIVRFQVPAVDPDSLLDEWFSSHVVFGTKVYPMNVPVSYYDLMPKLPVLPAYAKPLDARFGEIAALRGVYLPVTGGSARDSRLHPPSNWVEVLLYWETLKPGADFRPRVRFTDGYGQVYGGDLNGEAGKDLLHFAPVVTWKSGEIWQAIYNLNLNPETPAGVYNIEVTVQDVATGQVLPASGADAGASWVIAGHFTIR